MKKAIILQSVLLTSLIVASPIRAQSANVLKFVAPEKRYPLLTTDPREKYL